jgi:hypothetical protein
MMGALHKIRPNVELINQVEKMTWKRDTISKRDKTIFKRIASEPKRMFEPKELAKELNLTEDEIYNSCERLENRNLIEVSLYQVMVIDSVEYGIDDYPIIGKVGFQFLELVEFDGE